MGMAKSKNREEAVLVVKLPPVLKAYIKRQAARSFASMNAEVVRCVQERMDREQSTRRESA
jgi:hypothetical protein